jgi:hypothetical protein
MSVGWSASENEKAILRFYEIRFFYQYYFAASDAVGARVGRFARI